MPQLIVLCGLVTIFYMMATDRGNLPFLGALVIALALIWTALRGDGKEVK